MDAFHITPLLRTAIVAVWDVVCDGSGDHAGDASWQESAHLVFPYRGLWVRHDGDELAVAEAGQVLLANAGRERRETSTVLIDPRALGATGDDTRTDPHRD